MTPAADSTTQIAHRLPQRRRRFGLALVAIGVLALALQSRLEWLLPYDFGGLELLRRRLGWPGLGSAALTWAWAVAAAALLALLAWLPRAAEAAALAAGIVLGSVCLAAGGSAPALVLLLLVGVASLGWQTRAQGGLALLLASALAAAGWDLVLSDHPTLWLAALVLVAMFVWIDRQHIRASDRRLVAALDERDALIRDLDARGAQLQQVQGARTRLLASISHDLRQPLQAMRLYAEALAGRPETDARGRELLRRQLQAADDAAAMLDQFSEYSAIEQGMLASHPEAVNLRALLDRVAAALQATHPRTRLRLAVHGRLDASWVWLDRSQIMRIVQNLAGNAVRYSAGVPARGPARVVLAVRPHGRDLVLDVVDNGRGIPEDKLGLVFEPYVQLAAGSGTREAEAARAGRGLGLAIVRGLVAQLGLAIAPVRSRPGRGTRFRVLVPAALRRAPPAAPGARSPAPTRLDGWLLALLDDEDAPRCALRAALEGLGATIVDAATAAQLEAALDAQLRFPDALVFDLDLGEDQPDGRAVLAGLRQKWELQVPAVILSGRAGSRSVILPPRCTLHEKPVSLADLAATLQRLAPRTAPA
ncbi:MAG: HAMP domain-containing sensor histidine kinase [Rubrivivax sp.]